MADVSLTIVGGGRVEEGTGGETGMAEKVGRAGRVAEDDKRLGAGVEGSGSSSNLRTFQIIARFGNPLMGAIPL